MTINQYATPDQRGAFVRAVAVAGIALCAVLGLAMALMGVVLFDRPVGKSVLCFGWCC